MNTLRSVPVFVMLIISMALFMGVESAASASEEEIFQWVLSELDSSKAYSMPEFQFVSKQRLQEIFQQSNEKSLQRWSDEIGHEKATEMMEMYLRELIGLYNPDSETVYVGEFLDPCRRHAVLAHEFTHHIQVKEEGRVDRNLYGASNTIMFREMQAKSIENRYMEEFCEMP